MKTVLLKCEVCGINFQRSLKETKRSRKLGRRTYCSRRCCGTDNSCNLPPPSPAAIARIKKYAGIYRKPVCPFNYFLRKDKNSLLSKEYLQSLWESQNGTCPLTGCKLKLPYGVKGWDGFNNYIERASLDRIDNKKLHEPDNVRFISFVANCARNTFEDEELIKFCTAVCSFQKNGIFKQILPGRQEDFEEYVRLAKRRPRPCSIKAEDLRRIWTKQGGVCAYSGIPLDNPGPRRYWSKAIKHPFRASLDRIDSSKGYFPDNVHFVSLIANYAKNSFSEEILLEFCRKVVHNNEEAISWCI